MTSVITGDKELLKKRDVVTAYSKGGFIRDASLTVVFVLG